MTQTPRHEDLGLAGTLGLQEFPAIALRSDCHPQLLMGCSDGPELVPHV